MNKLVPFINGHYIVCNCPYCEARTQSFIVEIGNRDTDKRPKITEKSESDHLSINFYMTRCIVCEKATIYVEKDMQESKVKGRVLGQSNKTYLKVLSRRMIYPIKKINPEIPAASLSMPKDVKKLYDEAASVFDLSPRSSGALIRLTLEKFLKKYIFGDKNKRLDDMIGRLSTNYPDYILRLMDNIRNEGNSSVHGEISQLKDNENKEKVLKLFSFINMICNLLGTLKESDKIFEDSPEGKKQHIKQRNKKNKVAKS